ncbi:hypothetical protein [Treponema pedis]|uniref:hypothetical protein n=1 Tax=Treponema pedis TaxID=409322 RepID=UPI002091927A|nr:hypothetical protein [Treponema pedis]
MVIFRQLLLYVPAVLILPIFFGIRGIWISTPLVDTFVMILSMLIVVKLFKKELNTKNPQQS